nr:prepilin-type N-terminal cleavage/methylation domain-containing protein [Bacilli bacterium]
MNKKGFTLIELLAVIVILAIIALIVTPVVSNIISSAKKAANARSVEGHVKNIEYAIIQKAFEEGTGDLGIYNVAAPGGALSASVDALLPDGDKITCEKYTIVNGTVTKAETCTAEGWGTGNTFNYAEGSGATAQ